ncbi:MAG TPA: hypothetical protein VMU98_05900 [Acidimicrobiales bacterium]|nr:hypothetical protein [Acidimicrobiales bacterium]
MSDTPGREPDLVDRLLGLVDHALDVVHDRVIRPVLLAGRFLAYGFILVLVSLVLVSVVIIGLVRLMNVYLFSGREWLSYFLIGALSLIAGLIVWRRRRPLNLRK